MYRPNKGEECFVRLPSSGQWIESMIYMIDDETLAHKPKGYPIQIDLVRCVDFRPLKSKRDEEIEEMRSVIDGMPTWQSISEKLYDSGYRKQLPYDEFVSILRNSIIELSGGWHPSNAQCAEIASKLGREPGDF